MAWVAECGPFRRRNLPSALLEPGQTRHLPTRLVSSSPPDPQAGVKLPEQGEPLQLSDIADVNDNPRVQKALRRLAADAAPSRSSRLVMWNVAGGTGLGEPRAIVRGLGQPFRGDSCQGFRRASRHLAGRRNRTITLRGERVRLVERGGCGRGENRIQAKMVLGLLAEVGIPDATRGSDGRLPDAVVGRARHRCR